MQSVTRLLYQRSVGAVCRSAFHGLMMPEAFWRRSPFFFKKKYSGE